MKNILTSFFLIIVILFSSCRDSFVSRRDYYTLNRLDSSSLTLFEFYNNGIMSSISDYKDSILDGWQIAFREDGSLLYKGHFQDGLRNGYWYFYPASKFDTLIPEKVEYWKDGKQFGHQYDYYFNGQIKEYIFYNPIGKPIYKRSYSLYGEYIEYGDLKPQVIIKRDNNILRVNDTLNITVIGIKPPLTKSKIDISVIGLDSQIISNDLDTFSQSVYFSLPLVKPGRLKIQFILTLEEGFRIINDTSYFTMEVIN